MKYFNWSSAKNQILKRERGLSFEDFQPLDQEEKDLMESIEKEELQPVKNFERKKEEAIQAARNTLKKDKRINLRLS